MEDQKLRAAYIKSVAKTEGASTVVKPVSKLL